MKLIFEDPTYSFELLRAMAHAPYNGADIGECLKTGYRIEEGNDESWYEEWLKTAQFVENIANNSLEGGHKVSAREAYLRASNYYRSAEFFIHHDPSDPRIIELSRKSRECFKEAGKLFVPELDVLEIPYENTTLPGYFLKSDVSKEPKPTIIIHTGFDGTGEELYFDGGAAAIRRGYNCLLIEGPGQGRVIREQNIKFRPDWEAVITPVVDYVLTREDVDPNKIALYGQSFGGYLAPRAVAFEHRIKACISNGGIYDFFEPMVAKTGISREKLMNWIDSNPDEVDKAIYEFIKNDSEARWGTQDGMWKFGADTPHELYLKESQYTLEGIVDKIKCHMLIIDSEKEQFFAGQPKKLYDALKSPKDLMLFTAEEAAEEHCQAGATSLSHQKIFDWLDNVFNLVKK
ncbi:MAG: alpha/beta hydrolase family protein [Methanobacterium sp.]